MELTLTENSFVGACTRVLHENTNLRRIAKSESPLFNGKNYKFSTEKAYKRYVPFVGPTVVCFVENDEIEKRSNGGGFFPDYMCTNGKFTFVSEWAGWMNNLDTVREEIDKLKITLGNYLDIIWETKEILTIKVKNPNDSLIEFHFFPYNIGFSLNIIKRA